MKESIYAYKSLRFSQGPLQELRAVYHRQYYMGENTRGEDAICEH